MANGNGGNGGNGGDGGKKKRAAPMGFLLRVGDANAEVPAVLYGEGNDCTPKTKLGIVLLPRSGQGYVYRVGPDGVTTWSSTKTSDAPKEPATRAKPEAALKEVQRLLKSSIEHRPTPLQGVWKGRMICTDKGPQIVLTRALGGSNTVAVVSHLDGSWEWAATRPARGHVPGERLVSSHKKGARTLSAVIGEALVSGLQLAASGCVVRTAVVSPPKDAAQAAKQAAAKEKREALAAKQRETGAAGKGAAGKDTAKGTAASKRAAAKAKKEREALAAKAKVERAKTRKVEAAAKKKQRAADAKARKVQRAADRIAKKAEKRLASAPKAVKEAKGQWFRVKPKVTHAGVEGKVVEYDAGKTRGDWHFTLDVGGLGEKKIRVARKNARKMRAAPKPPKAKAERKTRKAKAGTGAALPKAKPPALPASVAESAAQRFAAIAGGSLAF